MAEDELIESQGVVVLLDVLGTRANSSGQALETLKKFESFARDATESTSTALRAGERLGMRPSTLVPKIMGDMIVLLFPGHQANGDESIILSEMGYCIHRIVQLFLRAIETQVFLRGAISYGDFVYSKRGNSVVGPAITDAANWCEKADWIGIQLTPSCGMHLETIQNSDVKNLGCILFDLPMSAKSHVRILKTWCCDWPSQFSGKLSKILGEEKVAKEAETRKDRNRLIKLLTTKLPFFPLGVESKYLNTLDFFDYCCGTQRKG